MWRQLLEDGRSAFNDHWPHSLLIPAAVGLGGAILCWNLHGQKIKTLELGEGWWGPGEKPHTHGEDTRVRPFVIEASEADIKDLHRRLDGTRFFSPLEDSKFHYGFNSEHLKTVISYWRNKYDWEKQVKILNKYPHFKTTIEGLNVHFIHVKPSHVTCKQVYPLLMIHGWPGSFYEFYPILPFLTDPGNHGLNQNIAFEVICPSIPGYGFSEAPSKTGFNAFDAARIFYKLMLRLGFNEFYLQGGDWGSRIACLLSQMKPESIKGLHLNFVMKMPGGLGWLIFLLIGRCVPWLVGLTGEDSKRIYPFMEKNVYTNLRETGYLHIQATKPDTIGSALNDSPAGLAAYILEKFSTATDISFQDLEDGGLDRKFSLDDLLTNIMIYWITGTISSSMRFYKENFTFNFNNTPDIKMAISVPTGIAAFPCEMAHIPPVWAKQKFHNIVSYTYMPCGGHFAAFEVPELLALDIRKLVSKTEKERKFDHVDIKTENTNKSIHVTSLPYFFSI